MNATISFPRDISRSHEILSRSHEILSRSHEIILLKKYFSHLTNSKKFFFQPTNIMKNNFLAKIILWERDLFFQLTNTNFFFFFNLRTLVKIISWERDLSCGNEIFVLGTRSFLWEQDLSRGNEIFLEVTWQGKTKNSTNF